MISILISQIDVLKFMLNEEADPDYVDYEKDWLKEEAEWDEYMNAYYNPDSDDSDDQEF
jgi:hypothetical protein